jgi:hypothetical protein
MPPVTTSGQPVYDPEVSFECIPQMEVNIISAQFASVWPKYQELSVLPADQSFIPTIDKHSMRAILWKDPQLKARLGTDIQPYIITSSYSHGIEEVQNQVQASFNHSL